jgi:superfamily II DNA/RNA helicase
MRIRSGSILGGVPYFEQQRLLSQPVDIIVATPGRLIDHMERGRISFSRLELLVLDEADRMLDMGFSEAVSSIAAATPSTRQTLLFTATWDKTMADLGGRLTKQPVRVEISGRKPTLDQIEQRVLAADDMQHKSRMLHRIIGDKIVTRAIIFSGTKLHADQLARELSEQGHAVEALHGDMSQGARNRAIMKMRQGRVRLLVATDVAARGIDVTGISHVINYDLPKNAEDYVHRIGRTGRAGASGTAISFVSSRELDSLRRIEHYIKQTLPRQVMPGLEPRFELRSPRTRTSGAASMKRPYSASRFAKRGPTSRMTEQQDGTPSFRKTRRRKDGEATAHFRTDQAGNRRHSREQSYRYR